MKLTVIGGGGVRSLFLAKSIAQKAEVLGLTDLVFMDNDAEKLRIYGGLAKEVARRVCPSLPFTLTDDPIAAVRDAAYIITTIRVGGDSMRCRDERIALDLGLLGQETTGAAGFSFAMRSVPALAAYCGLVGQYARPDCIVLNFTNPAGVVSQTLRDMGYAFTYGICDAPSGMLHSFAKLCGVPAERLQGELYGLNHLSYFERILLDGRDIVADLIENDDAYLHTDMRYFGKDLLRDRRCILNEYLYYFYYREQAIANILAAEQTRGEQIEALNRHMTAALRPMDTEKEFDACLCVFEKWYGMRENNYMASETGVRRQAPWHFDLYAQDAGGYAGVALRMMEIRKHRTAGSMILCVPNDGAIPTLYDTDVVEITCDVTENSVTPHKFPQADPDNLELIRRVKAYERLASEAIRKRDTATAIRALTLHPLVNSYSLAKKLMAQYLEHNRAYCDGWS